MLLEAGIESGANANMAGKRVCHSEEEILVALDDGEAFELGPSIESLNLMASSDSTKVDSWFLERSSIADNRVFLAGFQLLVDAICCSQFLTKLTICGFFVSTPHFVEGWGSPDHRPNRPNENPPKEACGYLYVARIIAENTSIVSLVLEENWFGELAAQGLAISLEQNAALMQLSISEGNPEFCYSNGYLMRAIMKNTRLNLSKLELETVSVNPCKNPLDFTDLLCLLILSKQSLKHLSIWGMALPSECMKRIVETVGTVRNIVDIDLTQTNAVYFRKNYLDATAVPLILTTLRSNRSLQQFKFSYCPSTLVPDNELEPIIREGHCNELLYNLSTNYRLFPIVSYYYLNSFELPHDVVLYIWEFVVTFLFDDNITLRNRLADIDIDWVHVFRLRKMYLAGIKLQCTK